MKKMVSDADRTAIETLVRGPKFPEREFVRSGRSFAQVHAMAARFRATLGSGERATPVCLGAEDRAVIAAALLASLGGGPELLLPYGYSGRALARMQQVTGFTTAVVDVDRDFPAGVQVVRPEPDCPADPAVLAKPDLKAGLVRIFTGGSTGSPQVWAKTAENIFAEALFLARRFSITEQDCIVATVPPCHIYGFLFSIVLPLVSGATVVADTPSFPGEIIHTIHEQGATVLAAVPAHYRALREKTIDDSRLRLAVSSAGMLGQAENEAFHTRNGVGVVEVYGSTETGGIATRNRSVGEDFFTAFSTVGWKVVDDRLAVCSPYISPDLTLDDEGFFITADRVEPRGGDGFFLKGRADAVTKVGGKRVDLEEIRLLIREAAGVGDCVVTALPEPGGRGNLIVALVQGRAVDTDVIKKMLAERLEPYARPRTLKVVDRIPVQKNGKYDRQAIARLFSA
ncbi:MAG TPA: acyl-CoA synthetase [Desulfobulbus sp.]|nr:acyl-CoA synthetase [Desulfobulbus sp.]